MGLGLGEKGGERQERRTSTTALKVTPPIRPRTVSPNSGSGSASTAESFPGAFLWGAVWAMEVMKLVC